MVRKESIFQEINYLKNIKEEKFNWKNQINKQNNSNNNIFVHHPKDFTRRQTAGLSINVLSMLMIFVLCYVCLFTVLICYGIILRTIRQFQKCGGVGSRRILKNVGGENRDEETTALFYNYQNNNRSTIGHGNSIYHKSNSRRCNSHRKWKSHLMSRHKYLIVIGTVLFVDILFLFPYSGIQMVALLHLNNLLATSQMSTLIRWGLQILIGIHSVCQPLCYFRMKEFRRLACCLGVRTRTRHYNGSGSSGSIFAQGGVGGGIGQQSNRSAKSVGSFKAAIKEDDSPITNPPKKKKSIVLSTFFSDSGSPIGEHNVTEQKEKVKYEKDIQVDKFICWRKANASYRSTSKMDT
ncbi:hypothetical protein Mgra_00006284 [Meloidogyne graminicola]|uniref:G_PROTEIN_RECEP_F1_2 domain-containing protein n=1 Tax=Meloidogyne graminicola TaxID=189291 RepID=A0A8S9ZMD4_9BILA|nr:hypothetical protein Mgra_00006284 [Meloidogyne graminicola]